MSEGESHHDIPPWGKWLTKLSPSIKGKGHLAGWQMPVSKVLPCIIPSLNIVKWQNYRNREQTSGCWGSGTVVTRTCDHEGTAKRGLCGDRTVLCLDWGDGIHTLYTNTNLLLLVLFLIRSEVTNGRVGPPAALWVQHKNFSWKQS
jgi:hypothetical protein